METVIVNGIAYGPMLPITVGASPFTLTNPEEIPITVFISGGTVTTISFLHQDGSTSVAVGLLGGQYIINPHQSLVVTYVLAPTMQYTAI